MWAIDDAISDLVTGDRKLAILDAASVVHTREVMSCAMYSPFREDGKTPAQVQSEFMQRHGITHHQRAVVGAVDARGRAVVDLLPISKRLLIPGLLQRFRRIRGTVTIARRELIIWRVMNAIRSSRARLMSLRNRTSRVGVSNSDVRVPEALFVFKDHRQPEDEPPNGKPAT
jgi:hypothetical protein